MRDIPKIMVVLTLFVVILLTFVLTIKMLGSSRYINPPPETVYVDLGTQTIKASVIIVKPPEEPAPAEVPGG